MQEVLKIGRTAFLFSPFKGVKTASLGLFLRIGSRFEDKSLKGIAHFLEHMVFKGSRKYSHLQIKREIEGRGGSLNAFTSQEITAYYAHFLNKNLPKALDILADMVFDPLLKREDTAKERNVILEEIKMYKDLPASRAATILDKLLWGKHALGQEVVGYAPTVKSISSQDLRKFKDSYYLPSNMVVSFAGSYPKRKIVSLLRERMAKAGPKAELSSAAPLEHKGLRVEIERRNLQQAHLCMGFRSISYLSKKRTVAQLLNIILGANMSSRLFEELREKRSLCYDVSTEMRKYRDSGAFMVHMGLDKDKVTEALSVTIAELKKIKDKEVCGRELNRAKDYLLGQSAMTLEQPQGRMFYLAQNYITLGKIYDFKEIKKQVSSVASSQIRDFARQVFKFENLCVCCVGSISKAVEGKIRKAVHERA